MLKGFSSHIRKGLTVYHGGHSKRYALVEAEVKKNAINITRTEEFSSLAEVKNDGKAGVILCYSSPTVLSVESSESDPEKVLQGLIPGAKTEDFFIQKSTGLHQVYEFVNSHELDKVISELDNAGIQVTGVVLEKASLHVLFENLDQRIPGLEYQIGEQAQITAKDDSHSNLIKIDGEHLNPQKLVAFGSVLADEGGSLEEWNLSPLVTGNQKEVKGKSLLKMVTISCVSAILLASLINLFLFQSYTKELVEIDQKLYSSNASQERLVALKNQVAVQNELLESLNIIHPKLGAYFLDQLAEGIPKQINLNYLGLESPIKIKSRKKIEFRANELIVEGKTISTLALNDWIEHISEMENVSDVSLLSYEDSKKNRGKFVLQINLEDV